MGKFIDRTGQTFGYLTVLSYVKKKHYREPTMWICKCKCGTEKPFQLNSFIKGKSISCGCYQKEHGNQPGTKHGASYTSEYRTWLNIRERCVKRREVYKKDYWGRGITVCDEWLEFNNFYKDMGKRPKNATIERIDNEKGYCKENCRWATISEQQSNKRNNVWIELNGIRKTQQQWTNFYGLPKNIICKRLKLGWNIEKACTTPARKRNV